MPDRAAEPSTVWTIGHSNHPLNVFLELLGGHRIEVLVDVRSAPYSSYASHFNKEGLPEPLAERSVKYLFMGDLLGGRAEGDAFYDDEGYVRYDRVADRPEFQEGIARLFDGLARFRVALMCGEEDPTGCHRRLLVGRVLAERGVRVMHIRGDGREQSEDEVAAEEEFRKTRGQLTLFDLEEDQPWRSSGRRWAPWGVCGSVRPTAGAGPRSASSGPPSRRASTSPRATGSSRFASSSPTARCTPTRE